MLIYKLHLFPTIIYENYITSYSQLYPSSEADLSQEWENAGTRRKKRRYSKPTNFKQLYNKLYRFQHKLQVCHKVHWTMNTHDSKSTILAIAPTKSSILRPLSLVLTPTNNKLSEYNVLKLRGFTFDKEKIFDSKLLEINKKTAAKKDSKLKQT